MGKQNWWTSRSAADDGAESDSLDWLDEVDFDDEDDEDTDFVGGLWSRYGSYTPQAGRIDQTLRITTAQKLVQGFVDTFATGDKRYRVTFDESIGTAGTDYNARKVVVSHKPLFDKTLTDAQANSILTAMAVHESAHVRYGRNHARAIEALNDGQAFRVSNLLGDVHDEGSFRRDYPGYEDVFAPAIDYVAKGSLNGAELLDSSKLDPFNFAVAAVRYPQYADWTGNETERDWWTNWATRWGKSDKTADHVAGVREGLDHLRNAQREQEQDKGSQGKGKDTTDAQGESQDGGQGEGSGSESSSDSQGESGTGESGTGEQGETAPGSAETQPDFPADVLPSCFADAVGQTAQGNGQTLLVTETQAQQMVEQGKAIVEGDFGRGEVYWGPRGITNRRSQVAHSGSASGSIRAAFAQSRTGHYAVARHQKSGRLDNRSLVDIAQASGALFQRKSAPSEGKYLVWLLVDCSGSMAGLEIDDATTVAAALASASRFLPNVRLDIWGWTSAFRNSVSFGAVRVWQTGEPIANVGYLPNVPQGGTPDRETLAWAAKAIKTQCRNGEQPVIIIASDGFGSSYRGGEETVNAARKSGVAVVSVAIGRIDPEHQERLYGKGNFIQWAGSITATARPLGKLLAKIATGRAA